jgi:hypothetical protein
MSTKFKFNLLSAIAVRTNILNPTVLRKITMAIALCAPLMCASQAEAQVGTYTIPATIQADAFSSGGGVKNEVSTDSGGGFYTAYINTGDWMNYQNHKVIIPVTGDYLISYRVSSLYEGSSFTFNNINQGGSLSKINRITVPKTGGVQEWTTVQRTATLKAGPHYFGVRATNGGFTLNWIRITNVSQATSSSSYTKVSSSKSAAVSSKAVSSSAAKSSIKSSVKSSVPSSSKAASSLRISSKAASSTRSVVSSSKAASVGVSSSKSSSLASSSGYTAVAGPVGLTWIAPRLREDKTVLDITELGGYRLRYKSISDSKYTYITINNPWTTTYNFSWLEGEYTFEIAAFDEAGLLSDFSNFTD